MKVHKGMIYLEIFQGDKQDPFFRGLQESVLKSISIY